MYSQVPYPGENIPVTVEPGCFPPGMVLGNSDHYMVVGLLRGGTTREHIRYIAGRRLMPLTPPREPTREDTLFGDLRRAVLKPHRREQHRNAWISNETWKLVD